MHCSKTKGDAAAAFDYLWSTIDSIIQKYEETGDFTAQKKKGGAFRRQKVQQHHINVIMDYVSRHPSATIEEI